MDKCKLIKVERIPDYLKKYWLELRWNKFKKIKWKKQILEG